MLIDNCRQLAMTVPAIRAILWTFQPKPYQRIHRSSNLSLTYPQILLDAADLSCNLRGICWSWSRLPQSPYRISFFLPPHPHLLYSPCCLVRRHPPLRPAFGAKHYCLSLRRSHLRLVPSASPPLLTFNSHYLLCRFHSIRQ
jgi:hypothetical protein